MLLKCSILLMLFPMLAQTQIENEIRNYTDSTEFYLEKGRQLLVRNLSDSDIEKAIEIQEYLVEITRYTSFGAFSYGEELCLAMLTNRWAEAEAIVASYEDIRKPSVNYSYEIITYFIQKGER